MIFANGKDRLLTANSGTLPDVSGAMTDYFQKMTFEQIGKVVNGFIVDETTTAVSFHGVWQPFSGKQLMIKPEGQRAWNWFLLHSEPSLILDTDDVVMYLGTQYRVMFVNPYDLYGYREYHLIDDFSGVGPRVLP